MNKVVEDFLKIYTITDPSGGRRLKVSNESAPGSVQDFLTVTDPVGGRRIKVDLDSYPHKTTYDDLPDPTTVSNKIYIVLQSSGSKWIPSWLGGSYKPKGFYYSDGVTWEYMGEFPNQATQAEVNDGSAYDVFVSPLTLANSTYIQGSYRYTTSNTSLLSSDGTLDCVGNITITLPLLASITDNKIRNIINSGVNIITINSSGGQYIHDVTTFDLYAGESLSLQVGTGKWIVS